MPASTRHVVTALALLWLAGNALRLPILATPPVLTAVQADLRMSGTEVGILSGLPVLLFALVALPGSLLIARIGAVPALQVGLLVAALGAGLRGLADTVAILFVATAIMGAGIAVMQPALPAAVRQWLPDRIGLATAVFTNGLIVGEIIPVALMTPVVLPLVSGSWQGGLAVWALPLLAIAALIAISAPRAAAAAPGAAALRWQPDWGSPVVWRLALILGSANTAYFGANTFLPGYLEGAGRPDLISAGLTALNVAQLPASVLLILFATRLERRVWPLVSAGAACLVGVIGVATTAGVWTVVFAGVIGCSAGATLALSLGLPAQLRAPGDVAPTAAAMFAVGYAEAMAVSVLGGAAWDFFGAAGFAFLPVGLALLPLVTLPLGIRFDGARRTP